MKNIHPLALSVCVLFLSLPGCKDKKDETNTIPPAQISKTIGFNLLKKIKGIWNGPVTSTTALGSYPEWIVDFRPNSNNQISAKNELDKKNDIFMSFFIVKYYDKYRLAFRNGGSFVGMKRVSYFLVDSVLEAGPVSYYRFSEVKKGINRAYTEITFSKDKMTMKSYTTRYNNQSSATLHMSWEATLQDTTSCSAAVSNFEFPQYSETKDFSNTFQGVKESIYYSTTGNPTDDPFPEADQPNLGQASGSYTFAPGMTPASSKKIFLLITTQPLFSNNIFNTSGLRFRSRYVILETTDASYLFNYVHPGTYYYYAFCDNDGNNSFNAGDWVSTENKAFTVASKATASVSAQINFVIP